MEMLSIKHFKFILEILDPPNLIRSSKQIKKLNSFCRFFIVLAKRIQRLFICLFVTCTWLNEAYARACLKSLSKHKFSSLKADEKQIIKNIFWKLKHLKYGQGSYADGITLFDRPPPSMATKQPAMLSWQQKQKNQLKAELTAIKKVNISEKFKNKIYLCEKNKKSLVNNLQAKEKAKITLTLKEKKKIAASLEMKGVIVAELQASEEAKIKLPYAFKKAIGQIECHKNQTIAQELDQKHQAQPEAQSCLPDLVWSDGVKGLQAPSETILCHIHSNQFGNNSEWNGETSKNTCGYLQSYLKLKWQDPLDAGQQQILDLIKSALEIENAPDFQTAMQSKLNEKKPFLIPGGWRGSPGHAIFYEVIPQDEHKATFRLYNLGAGINKHGNQVVGNKTKYSCNVDWKSIPYDKLKAPAFLQALKELSTISVDGNEHDLYCALKDVLEPEKEEISGITYRSQQEAGICAWRSLLAMVATKLPPKEFKKLKCDIKLQSLIDYVSTNTSSHVMSFRLVNKSFKKMCRSLRKNCERKIIDESYKKQAESVLKPVKAWIHTHKQHKINPVHQDLPPELYIPPKGMLQNLPMTSNTSTQAAKDQISSLLNPQCSFINEKIKQIGYTPQTFTQDLPKVLKIAQTAWEQGEDLGLYSGLLQYVDSLPNDLADQLKTSFDMEQTIKDLSALGQLFFKSCFTVPNSEAILPRRVISLHKIVWLAHAVARKIPGFSNFYALAPLFGQQLFLTPTTQIELLKTAWPMLYLPNQGHLGKNFTAHLKFLYGDLEHLSDAEIYVSGMPSWLQSLRDLIASLDYLEDDPVARPINLNRQTDFQWEFKVKSPTKVTKHLVGIHESLGIDHPHLAKIPKYLHYSFCHRPINSSKLRKFLYHKDSKYRHSEIEILNNPAYKDIGISQQEFFELSSLFLKLATNLQAVKGLAYFMNYPEKLQDLDMQIIFQLVMTQGLMSNNLSSSFHKKLCDFLTDRYKWYAMHNDIQTAVFLLLMKRYLACRIPSISNQDNIIELRALLQRQGLGLEEKSLIYAELAATIAEKENPNSLEMQELLEGLCHVETYPIPQKWAEPMRDFALKEAVYKHAQAIQTHLLANATANQAALNKLLISIMPAAQTQNWQTIQEADKLPCFVSEDKKTIYYPALSKFETTEAQPILLPEDIRSNPLFLAFFPGIETGVLQSNGSYAFNDKAGVQTIVSGTPNFTLLQKLNFKEAEWVQFLPAQTLINKLTNPKGDQLFNYPLQSRWLTQELDAWRSVSNPNQIFFKERGAKEELYSVFLDGEHVKEIRRLKDGAILGASSGFLKHFEAPEYTHEWYVDGKLVQIELPRYGLSFVVENGKLLCEQFKGFFINHETPLSCIGSYTQYLVLENKKGIKKALLPVLELKKPKKQEVFLPAYELDFRLNNDDRSRLSYYSYDVQTNGQLFSLSKAANIYRASALTTVQEYKHAAICLHHHGYKTSAYTQEEGNILASMLKVPDVTGDNDANAAALAAYAGFLLLKNSHVHQNSAKTAKLLVTITRYYGHYLTHYRNATCFKFTKHQELFLLKKLAENAYLANPPLELQPEFLLRLQELDPVFFAKLPQDDQKNEGKWLKDYHLPTKLPAFHNNLPTAKTSKLITRQEQEVRESFKTFYQMAREGSTEDKEWLRVACHFMRHSRQGSKEIQQETKGLANFLLLILETPGTFPAPPEDDKLISEWKEAQLLTAKGLAKQKAAPHLSAKKTPFNLSPHQLENPPKPMPKVYLGYNLAKGPAPLAQEASEHLKAIPQETLTEKSSGKLHAHLQKYKGQDTAQDNELTRLEDDLSSYKKMEPPQLYALVDEHSLDSLRALTAVDQSEKLSLLARQKKILALANQIENCPHKKNDDQLQTWGEEKKKFKFEELVMNFGLQKPELLQARNPALSTIAINTLYTKIGNYLLDATSLAQKERAADLINKFDTAPNALEKQELLQLAANEMLATRHFDPRKKPAFLVFEHIANFLLRKSQVEKLEDFLVNGDLNPVMEMIMGSGKSKVLLPLLGLLNATPEALSLLVIPEALFETISSDSHSSLFEAFGIKVHSLHFDRNTNFNKYTLEILLDDLTCAMKKQEPVAITAKSVQCLLLKFFELWETQFQRTSPSEEMLLMEKILRTLAKSGHPILDEVDTLLNVMHEVSYSIGNKINPNEIEIGLIGQLYDLIYGDPEIRKHCRLESDPEPNKDAPALTEALYHKKIKTIIAQLACQEFKKDFAKDFTAQQMGLLHAYLTRDKSKLKAAQAFFDAQTPEVQNKMALIGEEICVLLPYSLTRNFNEKYGLDIPITAIPFAAANSPSRESKFAIQYVTQNFTYQAYMKKGISRDVILQEIDRIQALAIKEGKEQGGNADCAKTKAWQQFCKMKGSLDIPLFNFKDAHIDALEKQINASRTSKMHFVRDLILPQLEIYEYKLSCNAQNLVAFFTKSVSGFTGTLWNALSMHQKLKAMPETGTDAKTISLLWKNSRKAVSIIDEASPQEMLKTLGEFDLLSDSGGYFKEGGNETIAKQIALQRGKPVVYYNSNGEQAITDGIKVDLLSKSDKEEHERLTFLDQRRTTGANVKQKPTAEAIVTVGRNMLLRDLLQSCWRLRGLDKGQKIKFVITKEVATIIRQTLNLDEKQEIRFDEIFIFAVINQAKQQGIDCFKAFTQQLWNVPQMMLLWVLLSEEVSWQEKQQAWLQLRSLWIKPSVTEPRKAYGVIATEQPSEEVIKKEKQACVQFMENCFKTLPCLTKIGMEQKTAIEEIDKIAEILKAGMPAMLSTKTDEGQTVEVEEESQAETENEVEQEHEAIEDLPKLLEQFWFDGYHEKLTDVDLKAKNACAIPLSAYFKEDKELSAIAAAFENMYISTNLFQTPACNPSIQNMKLLGPVRGSFDMVLTKEKFTLIDARETHVYGCKNPYNLRVGFFTGDKNLSAEEKHNIIKTKFLDGMCDFTNEEADFVQSWVATHGREKMRNFYENHIINGFANKKNAYKESILKKILDDEYILKQIKA